MSANAMTHVVLTDDDGSGTTGTVLNNNLFDQVQDAVDAALGQIVQTKSGNYTVLATDDAVICTAALTLTLYAASGNGGRRLEVINTSTADVTLDGNAAETIDGAATYAVKAGARVSIRCNGSNWFTCTDTPIGLHQLYVPAAAMRPLSSGGCGWPEDATSTNNISGMPFDASSSEGAYFWVSLPKAWNEGTVTAKFFTFNKAGGSGDFVFSLAGVACGDDDAISASLGTAQQVTDGALAAYDVQISAATAAITIGGTPAAGDLVLFVVKRLPSDGSDTYASDVYLAGVQLTLTTDAETDD